MQCIIGGCTFAIALIYLEITMALSHNIWVFQAPQSNHIWDWCAFIVANLLIVLSFCDMCCCDKYAKRRNKELFKNMRSLSVPDETLNRSILKQWVVPDERSGTDFYSEMESTAFNESSQARSSRINNQSQQTSNTNHIVNIDATLLLANKNQSNGIE